MNLPVTAFLSGFALGGSLIMAIGAQNAFILRQGLARRHVFILCLICALSDALLIAAGMLGLGALVEAFPSLLFWVTLGGALFLFGYGSLAFWRALRPATLEAADGAQAGSLSSAIGTCLALTFLNPHVYLDTVLLLGSTAASYRNEAWFAFGAGAMTASFVWFFALGYGARFLAPLFASPTAWRILDGLIGVVMLLLAGLLATRLGV